jgi:hypothetical protein
VVHYRAQQSLELFGCAVGDRTLDPSTNRGHDVIRRHRWSGLAFRFQGDGVGLQCPDFAVKFGEAIRAGRLGQPPRLEGPEVSVDGRASFLERCSCAGQFGLAAGVLGMPGRRRALGGLLEDGAVIERGQGLSEDRLLELARG